MLEEAPFAFGTSSEVNSDWSCRLNSHCAIVTESGHAFALKAGVYWAATGLSPFRETDQTSKRVKMPNRRLVVTCVCRGPSVIGVDDRQLVQTLEQLFGEENALLTVGHFNHPGIEWDTDSFPHSGAGDTFIGWLQDKALTKHMTENTESMSSQQPSHLDLVINKYADDIQSLSHSVRHVIMR